jgi:hypothetical protein
VQQLACIRPLEHADFDALQALFVDVAAERLWIGPEPGFDADRYRGQWKKLVESTDGAAYAALVFDKLVGQVSIEPHHEYGYVIVFSSQPSFAAKASDVNCSIPQSSGQ